MIPCRPISLVSIFFLACIRKTQEGSMFMNMLPQKSTILENLFKAKPGLSQLILTCKVFWSDCFLLFFNILSTDTQMLQVTSAKIEPRAESKHKTIPRRCGIYPIKPTIQISLLPIGYSAITLFVLCWFLELSERKGEFHLKSLTQPTVYSGLGL